MIDPLIVVVAGVVVVALATVIGPRFNIAGPLILLAIGAGVSLLPFIPPFAVNPEIILVGVLPPLLYSAAVQLPAVEFRRDFAPIAGLSVLLVVFSSIVLGLFFWAVIPGLGLALGIALGAILSPTDAVATSIAKRLGISPRVVTLLEGESLLNDATALVLLRTATAAVASGFAFGDALASFAWAVVVALALGAIVGWVNLRVRERVSNSAANTALSFTVPFIAYLPTEHLGGSGLVAAVVAGIVTGQGAARRFTPEQRISDRLNWRTVELILEGGVFLVFGLELKDIVIANVRADEGLWHAAWLALSALGIVLAVRPCTCRRSSGCRVGGAAGVCARRIASRERGSAWTGSSGRTTTLPNSSARVPRIRRARHAEWAGCARASPAPWPISTTTATPRSARGTAL